MLPSQLLDCEESGKQRVFTRLVSLCLASLSSFWFPLWVQLGWSPLASGAIMCESLQEGLF